MECCCCFSTDLDFNNVNSCPNGHLACSDCIERAVSVAVGNLKIVKCFHQDGCDEYYPDVAIWRATRNLPLIKAYDNVVANINLKRSLEDDNTDSVIIDCPSCSNMVVIDTPIDRKKFKFYNCNNCKTVSCLDCKKIHTGACDERTRKAELETEKFILTCYCGTKIVRGDGCNKVQCVTCRKNWCWICKANLNGSSDDIYTNHFYDPTKRTTLDKCPLYGERRKNQKFAERRNDVVVRNKIITEESTVHLTISLDTCCSAPPATNEREQEASSSSSSNQNQNEREGQKENKRICLGTFKTKDNIPCTYRKKYGDFCGFHKI